MQKKLAQEYRSPKQTNTDNDVSRRPSSIDSEIEYRSPKYKNKSLPNTEVKPNQELTNKSKQFFSNEIKQMQDSLKNLFNSFFNKSDLINSFISSYSTTKTNLQNAFGIMNEELNSDNKWGEVTQKSLVSALELAAALLNVNEFLKLGSQEFTLSEFNELKNNLLGISINSNKLISLPYNEQISRAKSIKKALNSLIIFYNEIVDKVSNNKTLNFANKVVDAGKSVLSKIDLSNIDNILMNNINDFVLKIKSFKGDVNVPLTALKDKDTYLKWAENTLKITNPEDAKLFFTRYIKPQVNTAPINSNV